MADFESESERGPKQTTDEFPHVDVRELKREGRIGPGQEKLIVTEGVELSITWTHTNFGERPWLCCPACYRRVAILYEEEPAVLRCRRCLGLIYESQKQDQIGRARRRLKKILGRLEPDSSRPRGMHHSTYSKLIRDYREAMEEIEALIQERRAKQRLSKLARRRKWRRRNRESSTTRQD